jgi:Kef-type K+ transport system membrane component KefB/predicted amino acid-binding ACT domain protein
MTVTTVLFDILVVLIAAKLAAEAAERIGVPPVVGEIIAGIVIGPSVLNLVGSGDETLRTLGEIGVILLLLEVGLEMDLAELGAVGRASLLVATVGVISPMLLGLGAMELIGSDFNTSLFVASALTATSVGITARVFGDLHALATTEARTVLGAAVADDVMGLVVLTVVVRLVTEGSVSAPSVAGIVVVAVAFLVVGTIAGLRLAPPLFAAVERFSRSTGTLVALGLAFTLAFAEVADAAKLAPIVGAFVAGLALARSAQADRIRRELTPVGHLFIPVFFLQIGIDARIESFARATVLRDAAILLAVASIGKLLSPLGAIGSPGDKLLIGLGMLPRGEVGLIFATIGLQQGVLSDDLYASLLLVVLVTTLITPQLLKMRYTQLHAHARARAPTASAAAPAGGWLEVDDGQVHLAARPPDHLALPLALEAAAMLAAARPAPELLDWLANAAETPMSWDRRATDALVRVLDVGNARSWRFLENVGVLDRVLPELAQTLRSRQSDPFLLDPMSTHRWSTIERLRSIDDGDPLHEDFRELHHPEWLMLAALLVDGLEGDPNAVATARRIVRRLDLGAAAEQEIAGLIENQNLLWSAARRPDGLSEESVLQVAAHLDKPEYARALYLLSAARGDDRDRWEHERLGVLHDLVQAALANPSLTGLEARNLDGRRRAEAARVVGTNPRVVARINDAPRAYVLRQDSTAIARHAVLLEPPPTASEARVHVTETDAGWWIDVGARDRWGLLASVTSVLADAGLDVGEAVVATWPDGTALESFLVRTDKRPDAPRLKTGIEASFSETLSSVPLPESQITFDDCASPWQTVCEVRGPDKPGLLHALSTAFAAAAVQVHAARISADAGIAFDRFDLTDRDGHKIDDQTKHAIGEFIARGVTMKRRRFRRTALAATLI